MNNNTEYLLRYISMKDYKKLLSDKNSYVLDLLRDNYIDVNLNIRYLIKYGIKNIDKYIYNNTMDLITSHNDFIKKIEEYENNLSKDEVISLIENL